MPTDVGVRELKRDLSNYLKRAASGEEIRVTMRGEPMVLLRRVTPDQQGVDPVKAQWDELIAAGVVEAPTADKPDFGAATIEFSGSPVDAILEEREVDR